MNIEAKNAILIGWQPDMEPNKVLSILVATVRCDNFGTFQLGSLGPP